MYAHDAISNALEQVSWIAFGRIHVAYVHTIVYSVARFVPFVAENCARGFIHSFNSTFDNREKCIIANKNVEETAMILEYFIHAALEHEFGQFSACKTTCTLRGTLIDDKCTVVDMHFKAFYHLHNAS